jgi:hypothetical protein
MAGNGDTRLTINSLDDLNRIHRAEMDRRRQTKLNILQAVLGNAGNPSTELIRSDFLRFLLDGPRDIDAECGYPTWLTPDHYRAMYDREGIAKRVVVCEPEESWKVQPEVYEDEDPATDTEFETTWKRFVGKHNIWNLLLRADCLSGIGQFGVILLGLNDGKELWEPVEGVKEDGTWEEGLEHKVLYLRPFSEEVLFVKTRQRDASSPRFSQPLLYTIIFRDYPNWGVQAGEIISKDIHWSRVIHLADNRKMSEVFGTPRMQEVWNRLYDLRKIYSSSGEGYWKGAFPGMAFEVNPELVDQGVEMDTESIREEFQKYSNGLQRYLAVQGVTTKTLPPQFADPGSPAEAHLKAIAIAKGIPYRILWGSEQPALAGVQDTRAWNGRMMRRQNDYLTPMVIRPFVQRLIDVGAIAPTQDEGGFSVDWPDLNALTDLEKAQVAGAQTQTISTYVNGNVSQLVDPSMFLTEILGFDQEKKDAILEGAAEFNAPPQPAEGEEPVQVDEEGNPIPPGAEEAGAADGGQPPAQPPGQPGQAVEGATPAAPAAPAGEGAPMPDQQGTGQAPPNELRTTVGGSTALLELQMSYYKGEIPRDAAMANARLIFGFSNEEAAELFPEREPDAPGAVEKKKQEAAALAAAGRGKPPPPEGGKDDNDDSKDEDKPE